MKNNENTDKLATIKGMIESLTVSGLDELESILQKMVEQPLQGEPCPKPSPAHHKKAL